MEKNFVETINRLLTGIYSKVLLKLQTCNKRLRGTSN
jgi:hypothetical protein